MNSAKCRATEWTVGFGGDDIALSHFSMWNGEVSRWLVGEQQIGCW